MSGRFKMYFFLSNIIFSVVFDVVYDLCLI